MRKLPDPPALSVEELARRLECPFEGEGKTPIQGVASLEGAKKGDLVFVVHGKYFPLLEKSRASAAIIPVHENYKRIPIIKSENPYRTFIKAVGFFYKPYCPLPGIHPQALISPSAKLGKDVAVGPFSSISDEVEIGSGTVIFPHVTIYPRVSIGQNVIIHSQVSIREGTKIGNRVIIHNGAVIGSDGFGYLKEEDHTYLKIPQKGIVVIEDEVEVGANATIDRAALGETIIRKGTKIDNLIQIAHNVEIGENTILAAQTGIAGSTQVGKNVIMGGQVGVSDHVTIGDNVIVAAKSGIAKSIPPNSFVAGTPHMDIKEARKAWVLLPQLSELFKDVKKLKKKLEELESALHNFHGQK